MLYPQLKSLPEEYIKNKVNEFLLEDAPNGDFTANAIFPVPRKSKGVIEAEDNIVFAGRQVIPYFFSDSAKINMYCDDGDFIQNKATIAVIETDANHLLRVERPLLNLLQRLCGVATQTRKYVELAKSSGIRILDTRKTTPGLRIFEKYAVICGGGTNHRLDLTSGILIKDNHISATGSITLAVESVKAKNYNLPIEVEVDNFEQIEEALRSEIDGILLDNFTPEKTKEAVYFIRNFPTEKKIFIESSGGINLKNIEPYLSTGIDAISVGALTHSAPAANIHIEFE